MRLLIPLLAISLGLTSLAAAQDANEAKSLGSPEAKPAAKAVQKSLDDDVLKLLADDADVDLAPAGKPKDGTPTDGAQPPAKPELPGLDAKLTEELETDVAPDDADPIARIGEQMRRVQQQIAQAKSGAPTQTLQHQIVNELEEILKALEEQQKQRQKQGSNSQKQPQNSQRQTASQPQKQPGANQGNGQDGPREDNQKPARESTDQAGKERPPEGSMQRVPDLLSDRAVWGHLPEHERQVLIQAAKLQFLNEYRQMIEDYYTRLANPDKD